MSRRESGTSDGKVHTTTMEIARALWFPYEEYNLRLDQLFGNQPQKVINDGLMIAAEWRNMDAMSTFYSMGANMNYTNKAGFSVLETVLQGPDEYWREDVESAEQAVRFLASKGVTRKDITHNYIIKECCQTYMSKSQYLKEFLSQPKYTVWWHKPEDNKLTLQGEFDEEPMSTNKWSDISAEQFLYYVKKDEEIKKYIITRGFGDATVIPLTEMSKVQKKLSWLTTTLMGALDAPEVPGEYNDEE